MMEEEMGKYDLLKEIIKLCSPGTQLRMGLENILNANSGGLLLLMNEDDIKRYDDLIQPGFYVNTDYSPKKVYELAKMDGAVILNENVTKILYANVQLTPDPSLPSKETGMRHRNAERIAKQTGKISLAVSRRRGVVSIYWGAYTYVLKDLNFLITMVDQGLKAIEKYRYSYNKAVEILDNLEIEDRVTVFDVCKTLEKATAAIRIGIEIEPYIWEMGVNGRLAKMQLEEMLSDLNEHLELIVADYMVSKSIPEHENVRDICDKLQNLGEKDLIEYSKIANILGYKATKLIMEEPVTSRGIRLLRTMTKIPTNIVNKLVDQFSDLRAIKDADPESLKEVDGIGEKRSKTIIESLYRLRIRKRGAAVEE